MPLPGNDLELVNTDRLHNNCLSLLSERQV